MATVSQRRVKERPLKRLTTDVENMDPRQRKKVAIGVDGARSG
jgi:hypothetical protein